MSDILPSNCPTNCYIFYANDLGKFRRPSSAPWRPRSHISTPSCATQHPSSRCKTWKPNVAPGPITYFVALGCLIQAVYAFNFLGHGVSDLMPWSVTTPGLPGSITQCESHTGLQKTKPQKHRNKGTNQIKPNKTRSKTNRTNNQIMRLTCHDIN